MIVVVGMIGVACFDQVKGMEQELVKRSSELESGTQTQE